MLVKVDIACGGGGGGSENTSTYLNKKSSCYSLIDLKKIYYQKFMLTLGSL